jgi:alpha-glucosidase
MEPRGRVRTLALLCALAACSPLLPAMAADNAESDLASPDGRLRVTLDLRNGAAGYAVRLDGREVLRRSALGVIRNDADFTRDLRKAPGFASRSLEAVESRYELLTGKRRLNVYRANRHVYELQTTGGARMDIELQVSNDGFAFRYVFPETDVHVRRILREATSFNFREDARAYLQPLAPPRSGWHESNPSYEEYYDRDQQMGTLSLQGGPYVFPALFRSGDDWVSITEAGVGRNYCGSRLRPQLRSSEYFIDFPTALENSGTGPATPESTLPWKTPWRVVAIGSLKTLVESTLGTDLADPAPAAVKVPADGPGKASWSWPLLGDDQTVLPTQKKFIDYAAQMKWGYTLVDAGWDRLIGYDGLKELVEYGKARGVKILIWYNSAGSWNTTPQTPRDLLRTHAGRRSEFARIHDIGIAGVKVDFFAGDSQSTMNYYQDILADAAQSGLLVNFHGATLPRGWQRTYPNLMTVEAVRGLEFVTFEQRNADAEPAHAAMLPFARNLFDPMDFTPVVLDRIPNIERRTSSAFELALSVLFTSGIQHYAEIPEGMAKAPEYVREFLRQVPSVWDDVRFIDGLPGQYVVIARRAGRRWWVAGINADRSARTVKLDLAALGITGRGRLITDGSDALGFRSDYFPLDAGSSTGEITLTPRGGFVLSFD